MQFFIIAMCLILLLHFVNVEKCCERQIRLVCFS